MPSLEQLQKLLEADPDDAFLRYGVAMEYAKQGRAQEAVAAFTELRRRHPEYVPGYFMGARALEQAGDMEAAKGLYREGIAVARKVGDEHAAGEMSAALMMLE
jgi:predicted Zn-dependent protease